MESKLSCKIISVGKRRDGGTRFWCINHKADATAKYGHPNDKCRYADVPPVGNDERLRLEINQYSGGIAIWGAVPPVYDTTILPSDRGIHVHARSNKRKKKTIDRTFRAVTIAENGNEFEISELDAIYHMVSTIFGIQIKFLKCPICNWPHLDKDWFSVFPHRRHLCSGCGKNFSDYEIGIGNPISNLHNVINYPPTKNSRLAKKELEIKQSDFPRGIQIWGSNPAILWTREKPEESGIHVHAYLENCPEPSIDDTYCKVVIDGLELDPLMVRTLMAQNCLSHLKERIVTLQCDVCSECYFDEGVAAFTPATTRTCPMCRNIFKSHTKLRKVVSNPQMHVFDALSLNSVNPRREHPLDLIPETIHPYQ